MGVIRIKDLLISPKGDLVFAKNDISLVDDKDLIAQKVRIVLSTNKNEWFLNPDEGINFKAILKKSPNRDEMLDAIKDGLRQIDETFVITEYSFETVQRHLIIKFRAVNDSGEEVEFLAGELNAGNETKYIVCSLGAEDILKSGNAIDAMCICNTDSKVIIDSIT